ncbi:MAG: GAF domain-containing protein [Cytophagales bacterium]|nr:GAF domain-containing protein [Cytophagales bacterium]
MNKYLLPSLYFLLSAMLLFIGAYVYYFSHISMLNFVIFLGLLFAQLSTGSYFIYKNLVVNNKLTAEKDEIFKSVKEMTKDIKDVQDLNDSIVQELTLKFSALYDKAVLKIKEGKTEEQKLENILWLVCKELNFAQGIIYIVHKEDNKKYLRIATSYALFEDRTRIDNIEIGEGITGQVALTGSPVYIQEVPKGYLKVVSGLGEMYPDYIYISPIKSKNDDILAVIELSGFGAMNSEAINFTNEFIQKVISDIFTSKA